eukprot:862139_1
MMGVYYCIAYPVPMYQPITEWLQNNRRVSLRCFSQFEPEQNLKQITPSSIQSFGPMKEFRRSSLKRSVQKARKKAIPNSPAAKLYTDPSIDLAPRLTFHSVARLVMNMRSLKYASERARFVC